MHAALMFAGRTHAFERTVFGDLPGVLFQRCEQRVVRRFFDLVGIKRIFGQIEQVLAELHPCHRNAGFHRMVSRVGLQPFPVIETFECAARAGDIDLLVDDVPHGRLDGLQVVGIFRDLVQFEQTVVTRHHFIGFLPVVPRTPGFPTAFEREALRHRNPGQRFADQLRTFVGFPTADDVFGEVEVLAVPRTVI